MYKSAQEIRQKSNRTSSSIFLVSGDRPPRTLSVFQCLWPLLWFDHQIWQLVSTQTKNFPADLSTCSTWRIKRQRIAAQWADAVFETGGVIFSRIYTLAAAAAAAYQTFSSGESRWLLTVLVPLIHAITVPLSTPKQCFPSLYSVYCSLVLCSAPVPRVSNIFENLTAHSNCLMIVRKLY